jgi:hypothetical protein
MTKWLLPWMTLVVVAGCGLGDRSKQTASQPMQVQFENATVWQYKGDKLRFEIKAAVVELREETQEILARGNVTATIEPKLWVGKKR